MGDAPCRIQDDEIDDLRFDGIPDDSVRLEQEIVFGLRLQFNAFLPNKEFNQVIADTEDGQVPKIPTQCRFVLRLGNSSTIHITKSANLKVGIHRSVLLDFNDQRHVEIISGGTHRPFVLGQEAQWQQQTHHYDNTSSHLAALLFDD